MFGSGPEANLHVGAPTFIKVMGQELSYLGRRVTVTALTHNHDASDPGMEM